MSDDPKVFKRDLRRENAEIGWRVRAGRVLDNTIYFSLLAIIIVVTIPYGTVDAWWESLFECAMFLITGLWFLEVLIRGEWQIKRVRVLLPLVVITAYAFLQTVSLPTFLMKFVNQSSPGQAALTIDQFQTQLTAVKMLALTLFTALLLLHTSSARRLSLLVRVVIAVGVASAIFGVLRQFLQSPESTKGFVMPLLFYGMGYGQFLSPNAFAYVVEMSFGLVMGLALGGGVRRDRLLIYFALAAVIWTALVLSNSRGGVLGMVCQVIFLVFISLSWYAKRRLADEGGEGGRVGLIGSSWILRPLLVVLIIITLFGGVLWMGGDRLVGKQSFNQSGISGTSRKEIWHSSWQLIKQHPWIGIGFGNYFLAIPEFQTGSGQVRLEQAHNDFLDLAANGGIVAVLLALWFVAMVIWGARAALNSPDGYRRAACLGALAGILSIGVHSLVDFGLQITGIAVIFGCLVVIAVADSSVESKAAERFRPLNRVSAGGRPKAAAN